MLHICLRLNALVPMLVWCGLVRPYIGPSFHRQLRWLRIALDTRRRQFHCLPPPPLSAKPLRRGINSSRVFLSYTSPPPSPPPPHLQIKLATCRSHLPHKITMQIATLHPSLNLFYCPHLFPEEKSFKKQAFPNKNTKCPIDAHCHRHCRRDPRMTKDFIELRVC